MSYAGFRICLAGHYTKTKLHSTHLLAFCCLFLSISADYFKNEMINSEILPALKPIKVLLLPPEDA